jgi:hypothetical protein
LALNANRWLGFVFDLGAVHNGNINGYHLDSTFSNYLFGPRFSLHRGRVRPYFNILFGGMHAGTSTAFSGVPVATPLIYDPGSTTPIPPNTPVTGRLVASQTAFAMTTGGGLGTLTPETSLAKSLSVILTPNEFLPKTTNFSVALDYFEIEVIGEITQLGAGNIVNGCYSSDFFPNDPLCALFVRGSASDPNTIEEAFKGGTAPGEPGAPSSGVIGANSAATPGTTPGDVGEGTGGLY